jgi:hypothetical protein
MKVLVRKVPHKSDQKKLNEQLIMWGSVVYFTPPPKSELTITMQKATDLFPATMKKLNHF